MVERDTETGVEVTGLAKSFGSVQAVRGIDVVIAPGETVALLGPNGAGKSTTIDMILGLSRPDAGRVTVFGRTPEDAVNAGLVAAMLQTGELIHDLTVRELVTMVASLYPHPLVVDDVLALTGITDIADRRTHKLSGGQTQRVRFAIALVADPDLLVLDEPTVTLDVEARHGFWTSLACVRGARPHGSLRDALSRRSRRVRRPHRAHGPRPDRRRRAVHRDQGAGRWPDDPDNPSVGRRRGARGPPRRHVGRTARRVGSR